MHQMQKKLLFLTYFFPPFPSIASVRTGGIAKYLKDYGWEVTVLTTEDVEVADEDYQVIRTPCGTSIYRYFSNIFKKYKTITDGTVSRNEKRGIKFLMLDLAKRIVFKSGLFMPFPDEIIKWKKFAVAKAIELHGRQRFDALLSSSGPVSINPIAAEIKKQTGLRWVADFRDLWSQNPYHTHNNIKIYFEKKLEIKTLKLADALVTVSEPLTTEFKKLHQAKPIYTITNGYDPEELQLAEGNIDKRFLIIYTGRFYPGRRDPEGFFCALSELAEENKIDKKKLVVEFYGFFGSYLAALIDKYNLAGVVVEKGYLERQAILAKQRSAQLLLSISSNLPQDKGIVTGKLFEYLAAQRPILALGTNEDTELARILKATCAGVSAPTVEKIKEHFLKYYEEYEASGTIEYQGHPDKIKNYSHEEMAKEFAAILNKFVTTNKFQ